MSTADESLSPDETEWEIVRGRGDTAASLGKALAHLEVAAREVERLRALGDAEYVSGQEGLDTLHWVGEARRAAQAGLRIAQTIAGTEITSTSAQPAPRDRSSHQRDSHRAAKRSTSMGFRGFSQLPGWLP